MTEAGIGLNAHTFEKNYPPEYFSHKNILFIQNKIIEILLREFKERIIVPVEDIVRTMDTVMTEKFESIPKMNQRVIMYITNEFRTHQIQRNKHMLLEEYYPLSQSLYDPSSLTARFDSQSVKLANRFGQPKVGGTARFYFT